MPLGIFMLAPMHPGSVGESRQQPRQRAACILCLARRAIAYSFGKFMISAEDGFFK